MSKDADLSGQSLRISKKIPATPDRVFAAWTDPNELKNWWGPEDVTCIEAEIDLREGGGYRIANQMPDGSTMWISGTFQRVDSPNMLVYSWRVEGVTESEERVTVRFDPVGNETNVVILHEGIATAEIFTGHQRGWVGCLSGLCEQFASSR